MKVTVELDLPMTVKVKAKITPEVPMTRHYPGDPPCIEEVVVVSLYGQEVSERISDFIYKNHEKEIDDAIWDKVNYEMYEQWAADAQDEADYRRDILEDR